MSKFLSLAVMCSLTLPALALAQPESPKTEEDETMGMEEGTPAGTASTPALEEMPESPKVADDDLGSEGPAEGPSFLDNVDWMVMASAFYRVGGYTDDGVVAGAYNNNPYPYTNYNGFGLNFVGGDFQFTGEKFAIRMDLRFGPGSFLLSPIAPVKQGYVSWIPSDKVTLDFGFFDTVFGGEVVDEWNNANYTRGALYFLRQPFNHMGIRAAFALGDVAGMTLLVTNGGVLGGTPVDGNETPTLGWQFSLGNDDVGFFFGGQHGAGNANDNKNWSNFFDWVLTANAGIFTLIANGDYQTLPSGGAGDGSLAFAYGHSLQILLDPTAKFGIGIRGEHLSGNEQYRNFFAGIDNGLATATLTLRYKPVEYLVMSLEGRGEWNTREVYNARSTILDGGPQKKQNYAAILGFTAYIGN